MIQGEFGTATPRIQTVADLPLSRDKEYCDSYADGFQHNRWLGERMFQCRTKVIQIGMYTEENGAPVLQGFIYVRESRNVTTKWNDTSWYDQLALKVQNVVAVRPEAAPILETAQLTWKMVCGAGFTACVTAGDTTIGPVSVAQLRAGRTAEARLGLYAPANQGVTGVSSWRFTSKAPGYTDASGNTGVTPDIRCDAFGGLRSTQGCAFTDVPPVMDYTATTTLGEFLAHVQRAQQSGLPGSYTGDAPPLERVVAAATIRQNRAGTCGGVTGPRNNGKSCDEYPFASTFEGGRVGGPQDGGTARTFTPPCNIVDSGITPGGTGSQGYSVCLIDAGQNARAGALLGWFYAKNRVAAGDKFYVQVTN